jgi:hypothetical protein
MMTAIEGHRCLHISSFLIESRHYKHLAIFFYRQPKYQYHISQLNQ